MSKSNKLTNNERSNAARGESAVQWVNVGAKLKSQKTMMVSGSGLRYFGPSLFRLRSLGRLQDNVKGKGEGPEARKKRHEKNAKNQLAKNSEKNKKKKKTNSTRHGQHGKAPKGKPNELMARPWRTKNALFEAKQV